LIDLPSFAVLTGVKAFSFSAFLPHWSLNR
jgi:hypothetical protein